MPEKKPLKLVLTHNFCAATYGPFQNSVKNIDKMPLSLYVVDPKLIVVGQFTEESFAPDKEALEREYRKRCRDTGVEALDDPPVSYFARRDIGEMPDFKGLSNFPVPNERTLESIEIEKGDFLYKAMWFQDTGEVRVSPGVFYYAAAIDEVPAEHYNVITAGMTIERVEEVEGRIEQVRSRMSKLDPLSVRDLVTEQVNPNLNELLAREIDLRDIKTKKWYGAAGGYHPRTAKFLRDAYRKSGVDVVDDTVRASVAELPKTLDGKFITGYVLAQPREPVGSK